MNFYRNFLQVEAPAMLRTLAPDAQPLWGVMSGRHMAEHISRPMWLVTSGIDFPIMLTPEQIARRQHHTFVLQTPIPRSLKVLFVSEEPEPFNFPDMEAAIVEFERQLAAFYQFFEEQPAAIKTHPMLGGLNASQWEYFAAQHTQHHFMQFGLLPDGTVLPPLQPADAAE